MYSPKLHLQYMRTSLYTFLHRDSDIFVVFSGNLKMNGIVWLPRLRASSRRAK